MRTNISREAVRICPCGNRKVGAEMSAKANDDLTAEELADLRIQIRIGYAAVHQNEFLRAVAQLQRLTERRCEDCRHWQGYLASRTGLCDHPLVTVRSAWAADESCSRFTPKPTETK